MYPSILVFATLPFLTAALRVPSSRSASSGISIPIAKRSSIHTSGTVDILAIENQIYNTIAYALRGITVFSNDQAPLAWTEIFTMALGRTRKTLADPTSFLGTSNRCSQGNEPLVASP